MTDPQNLKAAPTDLSDLTDVEWRVLEALTGGGDEYCFSLRTIAGDAGLHRELARGACRSLADRGLARFTRGLMTEDGEIAGSGYGPTSAGLHAHWNRTAPLPSPEAGDPQAGGGGR